MLNVKFTVFTPSRNGTTRLLGLKLKESGNSISMDK
jgi:hypothetical protein